MCLGITVENAMTIKKPFFYKGKDCFVLYREFMCCDGRLAPARLPADCWPSENPYRITKIRGKSYAVNPKLTEQSVVLCTRDVKNCGDSYSKQIRLSMPRLGMHAYALPLPKMIARDIQADPIFYAIPMLVNGVDIQIFGDEDMVVVKRAIFPPWKDLKPMLEVDIDRLAYSYPHMKLVKKRDLDFETARQNYEDVHKVLESMWRNRREAEKRGL